MIEKRVDVYCSFGDRDW